MTGAFRGEVRDTTTNKPIPKARVLITNKEMDFQKPLLVTDANGVFLQNGLPGGVYTIEIAAEGYEKYSQEHALNVTVVNAVITVPFGLQPLTGGVITSSQERSPLPLNRDDARRGAAFTSWEAVALPLGATTQTRTFDELALLSWAVNPPQTLSVNAGPGIGAGVGSAGQFSVNGLRSRANNFTVDGSDNNDEDIGVRRQGYMALVPQPIESIEGYQVTTLLAPAKFGRNLGAQVNAVSKYGGAEHHGSVYLFGNERALNARNYFDQRFTPPATLIGQNGKAVQVVERLFNTNTQQDLTLPGAVPLPLEQRTRREQLQFGQFGLAVGGPLVPKRLFYFVSGEGQELRATRMSHFAVPTLAERGFLSSGETGLRGADLRQLNNQVGDALTIRPVTPTGAAIFSLFPFPNHPGGVYGAHTYTQTLRADGRGRIVSGRLDENFAWGGRQQQLTGRYNQTSDDRDLPTVGGALFSALRSHVETRNLSTYLNSDLGAPNAAHPVRNLLRLSYGRTRLRFDEVAERTALLASGRLPDEPFLLNAPYLSNETLPGEKCLNQNNQPTSTDCVTLVRRRLNDPLFRAFNLPAGNRLATSEDLTGPLGQVTIAGFSPIGTDVFNFQQRRVNNTYQVADEFTASLKQLNFAVGMDFRRSELNSNLPRNSRPLVTFNGTRPGGTFPNVSATDFVAAGAPSGFFQSLALTDAALNLRYYQYNAYVQGDWRVRPRLAVNFGVRYEYNTPPRELLRRIENTFADDVLNQFGGVGENLKQLIGGRRGIFEPDRNNFAPRVGAAYSHAFVRNWETVVRGGYGLYFDQILGAVVSQSRNVFPNFVTVNFGGGQPNVPFGIFNPATLNLANSQGQLTPLVSPGTLNALNLDGFGSQAGLLRAIRNTGFPSALSVTLPARNLPMPMAHQYALTIEQQLGGRLVASIAYVGTRGRNLLRFTTPNFGPNNLITPQEVSALLPNGALAGDLGRGFISPGLTGNGQPIPQFRGLVQAPRGPCPEDLTKLCARPLSELGAVYVFGTNARSDYNALQAELRGRLSPNLQFQLAYTWSKALDDVSDVFDLAGAFALPQNSSPLRLKLERGRANFDLPQRLTGYFTYVIPTRKGGWLHTGWRFSGSGQVQSGQPFTINSLFDVNGDGNLTDRLNTMAGLARTGRGEQPWELTTDITTSLLAAPGADGRVARNTFRNGNFILLNASISKDFAVTERQTITFRADLFNFINRTNFAIPVRFLEVPSEYFGKATDTVTPNARTQFALKYTF